MMSRSAAHIVLLLVLLICLRGGLGSGSGAGEPKIRCREAERQALCVYPYLRIGDINVLLSSWGEEEEKRECCQWIGIQCTNNSGRVIKLDLSRTTFHRDEYSYSRLLLGNISSSLFDLKHLSHLDLSHIYFGDVSSFPGSIGSLTKLRYLNLSGTYLNGETPPQLGNLSSLQFLDLSDTNLKIKSLNWVSRLSSLSGTTMSLANDCAHVVTNLPRFLSKLLLSNCNLPDTSTPTSPSLFNSSEVLKVLDLSTNLLSQSIFRWLFYYNRSLVHLHLGSCWSLEGPIPNGFNNMAALKYLDLSANHFDRIIPESFGNLISLTNLHLYTTQLEGFHPKSFWNMTALTFLRLSFNRLRGSIPESFRNMVALTYIDLGSNQLDSLNPKSFVNMTAIQYLSFEGNYIKGFIPNDFGNNMASLDYLDLSNNMLEGEIPKSIWKICTLRRFKAYNNRLSGKLRFAQLNSSMSCDSFSLEYLDLHQNKLTGSLSNFTLYSSLIELHLSMNQFSEISKNIGQLSKLYIMDLSENSIQGVISEVHFENLFNLNTMDLSANSSLVVKITSDWIPPF